jgi:CRISPR/Cas system-associated exonuclease Cas4 (RecB family)
MSTYYNPHRAAEWNYGGAKWKLSRSKIDLFLECPRCFYVDNKLGTKRPAGPAFTLNVAVDELCKREYDRYRTEQVVPPLVAAHDLALVPFRHPELEAWRDPFVGIEYTEPETGLRVSGGVDDIWHDPATGELYVVDYKATAKETEINSLADTSWGEQYARQVSVYQWLLRARGFTVSDTAYFVYANGDAGRDEFADTLHFRTALIPCTGDTAWILPTLREIKRCLENPVYPAPHPECDYCRYREACGRKLLALRPSTQAKPAVSGE